MFRIGVKMKEVTYEDWLKNPTPRMMWVWNDNVENKEKYKNGVTMDVLNKFIQFL